MIILREDSELVVTTQPDHAYFSGDLLHLWRFDGFEFHPRRQELIFAAREHDNGWREADSAPRVDPTTQRPHTFQTIPRQVRFEIWQTGVERFSEDHPYASLLVAHHALELHREHRGQPEWEDGLFSFLEESISELAERCEVPLQEVRRDYGLLEVTDLISLAACSGWEGSFERAGYRFSVEPGTTESIVRVDPFPLAGATRFEVASRRIVDRAYEDGVDLAVTLASARWYRRVIRVEKGA
ncbi:MAG: DUF3891 family protein [Deltaproteobacteria bacterium]|nr:DUF3891 family protein [Deltaproteobacteria bacterium]